MNTSTLPIMISEYSDLGQEKQAGFTIIELMITVTIVGILTAVAFPSFQQAYYTQLVKTTISDAHISLLLARSEAIKRNENVDIVSVTGGWQVQVSGSGTPLQTKNDVSDAITIQCNVSGDSGPDACPAPFVRYTRTGRVSSFIETRFFVAANSNVSMRCLTTSLSGRPFVEVDSDGDTTNGCN